MHLLEYHFYQMIKILNNDDIRQGLRREDWDGA